MIKIRGQFVFFDSRRVHNAVNSARRRVLSRAGALIRRTAKQSIRKAPFLTRKPRGRQRTDFRRKHSTPGRPPFYHERNKIKLIYYGYDAHTKSVVVGPILLGRSNAMRTLEYGGIVRVPERAHGRSTVRKAKLRKRPFMGPALKKHRKDLAPLWRDAVRK